MNGPEFDSTPRSPPRQRPGAAQPRGYKQGTDRRAPPNQPYVHRREHRPPRRLAEAEELLQRGDAPAGRLHAPGRRITGAGQRSPMTPERNDSGTAPDAQDAFHNEGGIRLAVKAISAFTIQPDRRDEFVRLFEGLVAQHFEPMRVAGCDSATIYVVVRPGKSSRDQRMGVSRGARENDAERGDGCVRTSVRAAGRSPHCDGARAVALVRPFDGSSPPPALGEDPRITQRGSRPLEWYTISAPDLRGEACAPDRGDPSKGRCGSRPWCPGSRPRPSRTTVRVP